MNEFEPLATQLIDDPRQIKAFTDPLRVRVLVVLAERAATNQQVADALGEPQAKVLYHIRFLLDIGLLKLVDTRIKGGNVEKYYRAVARSFSIQPTPELRGHVIGAEFQMLGDELAHSTQAWPGQQWVAMHARQLSRAQAEELGDLIYAYMQAAQVTPAERAAERHDYSIGFVLFRNPRDAEQPATTSEPPSED
jgi:DNA-binding transcriptional ArsR family regulator